MYSYLQASNAICHLVMMPLMRKQKQQQTINFYNNKKWQCAQSLKSIYINIYKIDVL